MDKEFEKQMLPCPHCSASRKLYDWDYGDYYPGFDGYTPGCSANSSHNLNFVGTAEECVAIWNERSE